jgi:hypothetical protein
MIRTATAWQRVSKAHRCPVCERPDWCLYVGPADAPEAVICGRVESPRRIGEAGWLHRLRPSATAWPPWERSIRRAVRLATEARSGPDLAEPAGRWRLPEDSPRLARLAASLGLSVWSLYCLSAGWSPEHRAWTFPMSNAAGQVVGIRLRLPSGRKLAVKGGREALFIPSGLTPGGRLLISEGPTDCAACLDWGFQAVGRPSCTGGGKRLRELAGWLRPDDVAIVADGDAPGQRGADYLAAVLVAYVPVVKLITPPPGIKDARQWKAAGGTAADVVAAIDAAEPRRLLVMCKRKDRCADARRAKETG